MGEYHHIVAAQAPQMLICLPLTFHPSALMSGLLPPHTPDSNKTDHPCHNFEKIPFCFTLPFASWSMDKGWKCNVISPFVHWLKFVSEAIKLLYLSEIVLNLWLSKKISRSSLIFSNGNIISAKLLSPNFMVIKLEAAVPIILGKKNPCAVSAQPPQMWDVLIRRDVLFTAQQDSYRLHKWSLS